MTIKWVGHTFEQVFSFKHKMKASHTDSNSQADYLALKYPNMINNIIIVCVFFLKWWQNNKLYCIQSDGTIWLRGIRVFTQNKLKTERDEWSSPVMVSFLNERFQECCIFNQISHFIAIGSEKRRSHFELNRINVCKRYFTDWEYYDQFLKSRCCAHNFLVTII